MFGEVLKPRRVAAVGSLLAGGACLLAIGCVVQLTLSDIRSVPHSGVKAALRMGKHGKRGVDCVHCHPGAKKEARAGLADRKFCMICHEEVDEAKDKFVVDGPFFDKQGRPKWKVVTAVAKDVIFSHAKHTKTHGCAECHGDIAHDKYGLVDLAGKFENCQRCHAKDESSGSCARCHKALRKSSRPHSHDVRWRRTHGRRVHRQGGIDAVDRTCYACHTQSSCMGCHRVEKPRGHTILWSRGGHGLVADIERERCTMCHTQDRCVHCHLANTPPRPAVPDHSLYNNWTDCSLCHGSLRAHVAFSDKCLFCHR